MFGRPRAALSALCHLEIRPVSSLKPAAVQPPVGLNHRFQHAVARKVHQTLAASGAPVHRWSTMWMTHFWTLAGSQKSGIDRKCMGGVFCINTICGEMLNLCSSTSRSLELATASGGLYLFCTWHDVKKPTPPRDSCDAQLVREKGAMGLAGGGGSGVQRPQQVRDDHSHV